MNEERRKKIKEAINHIDNGLNLLNEVQSDEQDAFDNLPENMQSGEKGENMQGALDSIQSAIDNVESAIGDLESIQ